MVMSKEAKAPPIRFRAKRRSRRCHRPHPSRLPHLQFSLSISKNSQAVPLLNAPHTAPLRAGPCPMCLIVFVSVTAPQLCSRQFVVRYRWTRATRILASARFRPANSPAFPLRCASRGFPVPPMESRVRYPGDGFFPLTISCLKIADPRRFRTGDMTISRISGSSRFSSNCF